MLKLLIFYFGLILFILSQWQFSVIEHPLRKKIDINVIYQQQMISHTIDNGATLEVILAHYQDQDIDYQRYNPEIKLYHHDTIVLYNQIDACVSINFATLNELMTLPGIKAGLANRIIDYRQTHGLFQRIEEITEVAGIKAAKYDQMKAYLCL